MPGPTVRTAGRALPHELRLISVRPPSPVPVPAVRPGQLECSSASRFARTARYLFVSLYTKAKVVAYDLASEQDPLPCVWERQVGYNPCGMAVALHDSVLIVAHLSEHTALLPVDLRAASPADWRCGAHFDKKSPALNLGDATRFAPTDLAYADGRLFMVDGGSDTVRILPWPWTRPPQRLHSLATALRSSH
jgi:hypothetical protein